MGEGKPELRHNREKDGIGSQARKSKEEKKKELRPMSSLTPHHLFVNPTPKDLTPTASGICTGPLFHPTC